jgi:hypothetical protein
MIELAIITTGEASVSPYRITVAPLAFHPCTGECHLETRAVHSCGGYQSKCTTCRHEGPVAFHLFGRDEGQTQEAAPELFARELTRYQGERS